MQFKNSALRLAGAAMIAVALTPWIGGTAANAAATDDSDCATRPADVPAFASCVILDENTGQNDALHGETWAWRDTNNDLHVNAYPVEALNGGGEAVQLCVQESGAYSADFKCLGNSGSRVYVGDDLTLVIDLDLYDITPTDPAFYSIHVNQGGKTTVSSGNGGNVPTDTPTETPTVSPTPTPTPTPTTTPATTPATTPVTTPVTTSNPVTTTAAAAVSVLPIKAENTTGADSEAAETEVLAAEAGTLPHTGAGLPLGALLVVSLGLLLAGGSLMLLPGLAVEKGKRRRH